MHENCSASFENEVEVLNKVRLMGFSNQYLPIPLRIVCDCGNEFDMSTFEDKCDKCNTIFAVTPCHAFDSNNVSKINL